MSNTTIVVLNMIVKCSDLVTIVGQEVYVVPKAIVDNAIHLLKEIK